MNVQKTTEKVQTVRTGADRLLLDAPDLIRNKRVGILTNHTGRLRTGLSLVDAVVHSGIATLAALFGPEHGLVGAVADGEVVDHGNHPAYGVPVFSLYGKTHKPTRAMLEGIDVLICDIQDVGARFYTFISTIALAMEAAAEERKTFVILDRPNPIRGVAFDGAVREESLKTFVAWMPLPVTHGMTIGELARMWNGERQLANAVQARLEVVGMERWHRGMWFDETGLPWIPPSPNMQRLATATVYPGTCFLEGTSASEGRGTDAPFELLGAPWMEPEKVLDSLSAFPSPGVEYAVEEFTPRVIPGVATKPKFSGTRCRGLRICVRDRNLIEPVRLGITIVAALKRSHPKEMELRNRRFDILTGSQSIRHLLEECAHPEKIWGGWKEKLEEFGAEREKYLMYRD